MLSCLFNITYSKLLHNVNYVLQETFCKKQCAIWQSWLTKDPENNNKKNTTHNIQQHGTESLQLCMHRMKIIFNIFGRTKNVAKLKPNIKINELSISCFDTKE